MSIQSDDIEDTGMSDTDAVAQLMANMKGKAAPAEPEDGDEDEESDEDDLEHIDEPDEDEDQDQDDDEDDQDDDDEDADEGDEGDEDEGGDKPADEPQTPAITEAPDDAIVKVTVDGAETTFKVADLKRLAGQEASLTRKSQEADLVGGRAAMALQGALESVLEDLEPYQGVDWVLEGQRMEPEEFAWHRETFNRLQSRYGKIVNAANAFHETAQAAQASAHKDRTARAVAALQDPTTGIEGYGEALHKDILAYGVSQGLDPEDAARIADAPVIKLIHKAMLHDKGKAAVAEKVKAVPAKVRKGGSRTPAAEPSAPSRRNPAAEKKIKSGAISDRDAVSALLGRWGAKAR